MPTEQRPSSRQHAPAATRRYLHEHPDEPLAIRPTTPTRARKRHREELTPLPEPISHGLDSDAKIDLGDVAALMSEAIAWIGGRPREQQILRVLVVFEDAPHTLAEIAQKFDLSTERIRQIESRGLAILVRQARKPDTPGAVLAALLHLPGPDAPDEAFADRVATIATSESEAPARVAIPFLLCAAVGYAFGLLYVDVHHVAGPLGDNLLRLTVGATVRVDELPPVQAELRQQSGDRAAANRGAVLVKLERDSGSRPLVFPAHRLDPRHQSAWCGVGLVRGGRGEE